MIHNLEEKIKKDFEDEEGKRHETFIEEARKAIAGKLKGMGIKHGEILRHDDYMETIGISKVAVFTVEDLKIAVRQDMYGKKCSHVAFLVVFKCETCGQEQWAPFEDLDGLGFALTRGHYGCTTSIAERIAFDVNIFPIEDDNLEPKNCN